MKVFCEHRKECGNTECFHIREHNHYDMCDIECPEHGSDGSICIRTISSIRKEKLEKLENDSNLR